MTTEQLLACDSCEWRGPETSTIRIDGLICCPKCKDTATTVDPPSSNHRSTIDEARVFVLTHYSEIQEAGPEFQTAHMLLEQCLCEIDRQRKALELVLNWLYDTRHYPNLAAMVKETLRPADETSVAPNRSMATISETLPNETTVVRGPYCQWCQGELSKPSPTCRVRETHALS